MAKSPIPIPENGGQVGPTGFQEKTEEKFKNIDTLIYAVVVAIVVTAISSLISVGAIIIDQLHFNNQTYREESQYWKSEAILNSRIDQLESDFKALKLNQNTPQ